MSFLLVNIVVGVVGTLLSGLLGKIIKDKHQDTVWGDLLGILQAGVVKANDEFAREKKRVNPDGKLTQEDQVTARSIALSYAANAVKGSTAKLMKTLDSEKVNSLIAGLVKDAR